MSKIEQVDPAKWKNFLEEFSTRNNDRRARIQIFSGRNVENEPAEAHLEEVRLKDDSGTLVITRIDRTQGGGEKVHDTITNVTGISVQYDTDGSESVLEITDKENELISLRMESRVDGAS